MLSKNNKLFSLLVDVTKTHSLFVYSLFIVCFCYNKLNTLRNVLHFCSFVGLRKVTDDMKSKNRAERSSIVNTSEIVQKKLPSLSKSVVAPNPKFELQMGRKYVF